MAQVCIMPYLAYMRNWYVMSPLLPKKILVLLVLGEYSDSMMCSVYHLHSYALPVTFPPESSVVQLWSAGSNVLCYTQRH